MTGFGGPSDTPYLFYSRRIGLNANRIIPIQLGGRLTGKVGPYAIGLMNIQTGNEAVSETEPTNFTVLRLKRDVFRRSSIGLMATNRSLSSSGDGSNQAYGVDGAFSISQDLSIGAYWARTVTTDLTGDDQSYQGHVDYNTDRYGARGEFLSIGSNFRPKSASRGVPASTGPGPNSASVLDRGHSGACGNSRGPALPSTSKTSTARCRRAA